MHVCVRVCVCVCVRACACVREEDFNTKGKQIEYIECLHVVHTACNYMVRADVAEAIEPVERDGVEDDTLVGNAIAHDLGDWVCMNVCE